MSERPAAPRLEAENAARQAWPFGPASNSEPARQLVIRHRLATERLRPGHRCSACRRIPVHRSLALPKHRRSTARSRMQNRRFGSPHYRRDLPPRAHRRRTGFSGTNLHRLRCRHLRTSQRHRRESRRLRRLAQHFRSPHRQCRPMLLMECLRHSSNTPARDSPSRALPW
jgi:hypothetical protein